MRITEHNSQAWMYDGYIDEVGYFTTKEELESVSFVKAAMSRPEFLKLVWKERVGHTDLIVIGDIGQESYPKIYLDVIGFVDIPNDIKQYYEELRS